MFTVLTLDCESKVIKSNTTYIQKYSVSTYFSKQDDFKNLNEVSMFSVSQIVRSKMLVKI